MDIPWQGRVSRGISPVVGVLLMVALTIVLASTLTFLFDFGGRLPSASAEEIVGGSPELQDETIIALNQNAGATDVRHSVVVEVETTLTGESLKEITITGLV